MPQTATATDACPLLSAREAARIAGVSLTTVYNEVQLGALPARHVGRRLRIEPAEVARYLKTEGGMR